MEHTQEETCEGCLYLIETNAGCYHLRRRKYETLPAEKDGEPGELDRRWNGMIPAALRPSPACEHFKGTLEWRKVKALESLAADFSSCIRSDYAHGCTFEVGHNK